MYRQLLRLQFHVVLIFAGITAYLGFTMVTLGWIALAVYSAGSLLMDCHIEVATARANGAPWWRCLRLALTGRTGPHRYRRRIDQ